MGETADRPLQRLSASALLYGRSGSIGAGGTADANSSETDGHTATDGARLTNNSAFTTESNGKDAARERREKDHSTRPMRGRLRRTLYISLTIAG